MTEDLDYVVQASDTATVPLPRRADFWRHHVTANHGRLRFEFARPHDFHGGTRVQRAGDVQLVDFWSDAMRYERRTADHERDGDAGLRLIVPVAGQVTVESDGARRRLGDGGAALVSMTRTFALGHDEHTRALILSVPATRWPGPEAPAGPLTWDTTTGVGRVVATMLTEVARQAGELDRTAFLTAALAAFDLAARGHPDRTRRLGELAAALVRRDAADPTYDPAALAAQLGLSLRTLQHRLSAEQTSPAVLIRTTRLELAARRLRDPAWSGRTIAAVAHGCGFSSLTAFTTAFRAAFARTPREWRATAPFSAGSPGPGGSGASAVVG